MTETQPDVSVVIPAYNQARYLAEAVQSALAQTTPAKEIIVVDDGSTDETAAVAASFDDQIGYVWQENQGLAAARNTGIAHARGEWVALLDSDDCWQPSFLEKMTALAAQAPRAAVYYCGVAYVDGDGRSLPQRAEIPALQPAAFRQQMLRNNFLVPSTVMLRRQVVIANGCFDPAFRRLQDWELWLRLLRAGVTFAGLEEALVRYRLHRDSLSTNAAAGRAAALALARKLYGEDDGDSGARSAEKARLYGGVYRYHVLSAVTQDGDWQAAPAHLANALRADASIALDLELFYELALGQQPLGFRGTEQFLQLERNAAAVEALTGKTIAFQNVGLTQRQKRELLGTAHYAVALAAYNTGRRALSRRFLQAAARQRPELRSEIVRLWLRTLPGSKQLRKVRSAWR